MDAFGSVEIVVNNAGLRRTGYFGSLTLEQIDDVLDSHLRAGFFVTQPAWEVMKRNSYGRVIFTGSAAGMFSCQGLSNYAAAKAGLYGLTKALAYEGREHGINVNCVLPWANTAVPGMAPRVQGYRDELRRYVDPDELARLPEWRTDTKLTAYLVAALVSPSCAITGEAISMCQGRFARSWSASARDGSRRRRAPSTPTSSWTTWRRSETRRSLSRRCGCTTSWRVSLRACPETGSDPPG